AAAVAAAPNSSQVSDSVQNQLTLSFASAEDTAKQYPQYASQITSGAKSSFLQGDQWAYTAGLAAVAAGALLVFFLFPRREAEERLLVGYHAEDARLVTVAP